MKSNSEKLHKRAIALFWFGTITVIFLGFLPAIITHMDIANSAAEQLKPPSFPKNWQEVTNLSKEETDRRKAQVELQETMNKRNSWSAIILDKVSLPIAIAIIIALVGQWLNYNYWLKQKEFENTKIKADKMIQLYSDASRLFTYFLQLIGYLSDAIKEETQARNEKKPDTEIADAAKARREYTRSRLDVEPTCARLLREISVYFGNEVKEHLNALRNLYNALPQEESIRAEQFSESFSRLVEAMEKDIKKQIGE